MFELLNGLVLENEIIGCRVVKRCNRGYPFVIYEKRLGGELVRK